MIRAIVFFIFLIVLPLSCCQDKKVSDHRGFDQQKIEKYNASSRFDYDRDIKPRSNAIVDALTWIFGHLFSWLSSTLGIIVLAVLIILAVLLIIKQIDKPKIEKEVNAFSLVFAKEEEIDTIDWEELVRKALSEKDYRLAIRYAYLNTLKILKGRDLIHWKKDKTNQQYLDELKGDPKNYFRKIVYIFEYVWYGEFDALRNHYDILLENESVLREIVEQ